MISGCSAHPIRIAMARVATVDTTACGFNWRKRSARSCVSGRHAGGRAGSRTKRERFSITTRWKASRKWSFPRQGRSVTISDVGELRIRRHARGNQQLPRASGNTKKSGVRQPLASNLARTIRCSPGIMHKQSEPAVQREVLAIQADHQAPHAHLRYSAGNATASLVSVSASDASPATTSRAGPIRRGENTMAFSSL